MNRLKVWKTRKLICIEKMINLKLKTLFVFLVALFLLFHEDSVEAKVVHISFETIRGCLTYLPAREQDVAFLKKITVSLDWVGDCVPGKPISGYGTLKVTQNISSKASLYSQTGTFVDGVPDGEVVAADSYHSGQSRNIYNMGCLKDEDDCSPRSRQSIDSQTASTVDNENTNAKTTAMGKLFTVKRKPQ